MGTDRYHHISDSHHTSAAAGGMTHRRVQLGVVGHKCHPSTQEEEPGDREAKGAKPQSHRVHNLACKRLSWSTTIGKVLRKAIWKDQPRSKRARGE